MTINAQYTSTASVFSLTATPASGNALPLTDPSALGNRPLAAYLQAEGANIRFTTDGSAPTSTVGILLVASAAPFFYSGPLNELRFIQVAGGAKLNVVYSQNPVEQGDDGPMGPQGPAGPAGTIADLPAALAALGVYPGGLPSVPIHLDSTQLNHLFSVPLPSFVVAPGAGKLLIPIRMIGKTTPGTISYPPSIFQAGQADPEKSPSWMYGSTGIVFPAPFDGSENSVFACSTIAPLAQLDADIGIDLFFGTDFAGAPFAGSCWGLIGGINQPLNLVFPIDATGSDGIDSSSVTVGAGGLGYAPLDESAITTGNADAVFVVDTVGALGVVLTGHLKTSGSGYSVSDGQATTVNTGSGDGNLTINVGAVGDGNGSLDILLFYQPITLP